MKWISVKDKLPEKEGFYLVLDWKWEYYVALYEKERSMNWEIQCKCHEGNDLIPNFWMELPKLPEEK